MSNKHCWFICVKTILGIILFCIIVFFFFYLYLDLISVITTSTPFFIFQFLDFSQHLAMEFISKSSQSLLGKKKSRVNQIPNSKAKPFLPLPHIERKLYVKGLIHFVSNICAFLELITAHRRIVIALFRLINDVMINYNA